MACAADDSARACPAVTVPEENGARAALKLAIGAAFAVFHVADCCEQLGAGAGRAAAAAFVGAGAGAAAWPHAVRARAAAAAAANVSGFMPGWTPGRPARST